MPDPGPAPGTTGTVSVEIDLHQAWYNLMTRVGVYGPKLVGDGHAHLDAVQKITGIKTNRLP